MTSGDINIRRDGFLRLLTAIAGEPTKERITCASGFCTVEIFPGQRAETQARIGQQFDPSYWLTSARPTSKLRFNRL